jgi:hypothetical protein
VAHKSVCGAIQEAGSDEIVESSDYDTNALTFSQ